ncbi:LacI family DNA-binding transcriptional regulator [Alteromonas sp. KUL49]|uniref:LacI family DNA-binding transcriptional regulator n=1 Tax=Alteromonas sp. KUL49 TaxID=2480798 RepID=UPI00102F017F|nr:LacI family DNA-binding transcriptional regulator [Alteromonas sp. KUL49]TAP40152.1 LacI family transcriptional regulator [Alteromonas sp. KUL49]GEA11270.1 hypothetical protein KUL49_16450 [Alteromonas sp. KUL49]
MVTIKDIARKAGVSPATVSRVINRTKPVCKETRERVQAVIAHYRYKPNQHARALVTGANPLVGLAYQRNADFDNGIVHEIETLAQADNAPLQIRSAGAHANDELNAITSLLAQGCSLVFVHSVYCDDHTLSTMAKHYDQLYFIGRHIDGAQNRCVFVEMQNTPRLEEHTTAQQFKRSCSSLLESARLCYLQGMQSLSV